MPIQSRVYLPEPVNLNHPLARGLVSWWLVVPGLDGGPKWYDVAGGNHGTLTSMASGYGWQRTMRPGGFGEMLFDGVSSYIDTGKLVIAGTASFTFSAWICWLATSSNYDLTVWNGADSITGGFGFYRIPGDNTIRAAWGSSVGMVTGPSPSNGTWNHLLSTYDGATHRFFVNGALQGSVAYSASNFTSGTTNFGHLLADSAYWSKCRLDDIRIYNRALSAADASDLYNNSRLGHPGVLNQTKAIFLVPPSTYDEVMSGGIWAGSSATVQTRYNFITGPVGVSAGGNTDIAATFMPTLPPTGTSADGQATNAAIYTVSLAMAGVVAGSSASVFVLQELRPTGGSQASGVSPAMMIVRPSIASSGVLCFGELSNQFAEDTSLDGPLVSGSAKVELRLGFHIYHRFNVGDIVYVPSALGTHYVQQQVRTRYRSTAAKDYYDIGIGWYPDTQLLSVDEFLVWRCKQAASIGCRARNRQT